MITSNLLIVSGKGKVEGGKGWHMPGKRLNCQAVRYRLYETTNNIKDFIKLPIKVSPCNTCNYNVLKNIKQI